MAWHINQYKKHKEFDRADFLTAQLYDDLMRREAGSDSYVGFTPGGIRE